MRCATVNDRSSLAGRRRPGFWPRSPHASTTMAVRYGPGPTVEPRHRAPGFDQRKVHWQQPLQPPAPSSSRRYCTSRIRPRCGYARMALLRPSCPPPPFMAAQQIILARMRRKKLTDAELHRPTCKASCTKNAARSVSLHHRWRTRHCQVPASVYIQPLWQPHPGLRAGGFTERPAGHRLSGSQPPPASVAPRDRGVAPSTPSPKMGATIWRDPKDRPVAPQPRTGHQPGAGTLPGAAQRSPALAHPV
jgi:hypothetical protein